MTTHGVPNQRMVPVTCSGCATRERQPADLRQVLQHLQRELRSHLGKKTVAVLDAFEGNGSLTPAEVAKRAKCPLPAAKHQLAKLKKRGLVRRVGWRDVPGSSWPVPEYSIVAAKDTLNGANGKE